LSFIKNRLKYVGFAKSGRYCLFNFSFQFGDPLEFYVQLLTRNL
jgi:hypothetical protein